MAPSLHAFLDSAQNCSRRAELERSSEAPPPPLRPDVSRLVSLHDLRPAAGHVSGHVDCMHRHLMLTTHDRMLTSAAGNETQLIYGSYGYLFQVRPGEIVLVVVLLAVWAFTIAVFLRKWRSIRILQPSEPRFKHAPKNLDTIKVITKHRDSVIYKSYTENITKTMQARQKRLDRMNTMPNIKLGEAIALTSIDEPRRCSSIDMKPAFMNKDHKGGSILTTVSSVGGGSADGGLESGIKNLAQSCTSIAISFHSNIISPVIEETEESETLLDAKSTVIEEEEEKTLVPAVVTAVDDTCIQIQVDAGTGREHSVT